MYGLASKPLYMALEATIDLLTACTAQQPSLAGTTAGPDFGFLRRFSLLAVNTMFAQQHWEGVVSGGLRLCEGVMVGGVEEVVWEREWVQDLVPVILEAQCRLAKRVADHCTDLKRDGVCVCVHVCVCVCVCVCVVCVCVCSVCVCVCVRVCVCMCV